MFITNIKHQHTVRDQRLRNSRPEFTPLQGNPNLLQEAETVSDLIDGVVSIFPWVNVDTLLPAL